MIDEVYFEEIYTEYNKLVYNLSLQYVLSTEDARDITQEVFVKIYQHYNQFNPAKASLKTWIYRITINQNLDFLKSRQSKKRYGFITSLFHNDSNESVIAAETVDHPGLVAEHKEAMKRLLLIIQALPENQKTAIILSKIEDRPQKEVAEIMNISVKAVESLLQRAKQNIQKKLTDTEGN